MPRRYTPPFSITPTVVGPVSEISEAAGRITVEAESATALRLRRINRGRTIQGTLAIPGGGGGTVFHQGADARLGLSHRPTLLYDYLKPALAGGWLEMTIPDRPKSPKQQYRFHEAGKESSRAHRCKPPG